MSDALHVLNQVQQIEFLSGVFGVNLTSATFTNSNNKKISFYLQDNLSNIPAAQYINGVTSTYDMIDSAFNGSSAVDANTKLFNTSVTTTGIQESFSNKGRRIPIPFQNYDVLVNSGTTGQNLVFNCIMAGTEYLKGYLNLVQVLFDPTSSGLGTLVHPFYGTINNCMPRGIGSVFQPQNLNCITFQLTIETSDILHLNPLNNPKSAIADGIAKALLSVNASIAAVTQTISLFKGGAV